MVGQGLCVLTQGRGLSYDIWMSLGISIKPNSERKHGARK